MSFLNSAFRDAYDLAFQVSPIILNGGIVADSPGGAMPVIGLTGQLAALTQGIITGGAVLDDFYARYLPIPGGTVIQNSVATYPFANQQVAANAIIEQPKNISLLMISPVNKTGGYLSKLAIFMGLVSSFASHNNAGGTYTIATPAFIYQNCIMISMTDVTGKDTKQVQTAWQLDFFKPLVTMEDASAAYSVQMGKISSGQVLTTSEPSGISGSGGYTGLPGSITSAQQAPQ